MQSAVIGIQSGKGELNPSSGLPGSLTFASMDVGSLDKGFMDRLGSAPLEQELDIRFTLGAAYPQTMPAPPLPQTAQHGAGAVQTWPASIGLGTTPFPQLSQQASAAAAPWLASAGGKLGSPAQQPWSDDAMETNFQFPDPAWDCATARSGSLSGSAAPPLGRPLSPEGSSQDGGDAAKLSGDRGHRAFDPPHNSFPAPPCAALPAAPSASGRCGSGDGASHDQQPQPGGLTNAISRDLVAKLAAGTAPHKPRVRSSKGQKAPSRGKPKVQGKIDDNESQVAELEEEVESLRTSNAKLENRNNLLEKYLRMVEEPAEEAEWWLDARTRAAAEKALNLSENLTFTVYEARPLRLTRTQVADLSFDNYEKLWKMFVDAFAACLLACGGRWDPAMPVAPRLKQLCFEAGALRVAVALAHPSRMTHYHFMMGQEEPEALEGQPQFWRELAAGLELQPEQRERIVHLRNLFLSKTGAMQRRRRAAAAQLEAALPQGDFNSQGGSRYLKATQACEQLLETLRHTYTLDLEMQVALWKSCLNPVQSASLMVRSHPRYPDILAIMNAVAEANGAPSAAELLADGEVPALPMSRLPLTGSDQGTGSTPCGGPLIFVKSEEQDYCLGVKL